VTDFERRLLKRCSAQSWFLDLDMHSFELRSDDPVSLSMFSAINLENCRSAHLL